MNFQLFKGQEQMLPGILTDEMIRGLCEAPKNVLHFKGRGVPSAVTTDAPIGQLDYTWTEGEIASFPVNLTEEEIAKTYRTGEEHLIGTFVGNNPVTEFELVNFRPMLTPFVGEQVRKDKVGRRIMSYGLSSMGYDVRLQPKFKIFSNTSGKVIDPLDMTDDHYDDITPITDQTGTYVILHSGGYLLGVTEEWFDMPPDTLAICLGKSTGARAGILVNTTPIEPGFAGNVVIEISNPTSSPMKIYAGMGIAQFLFFRAPQRCKVSYGDRGGKYQGQKGIQTAIV